MREVAHASSGDDAVAIGTKHQRPISPRTESERGSARRNWRVGAARGVRDTHAAMLTGARPGTWASHLARESPGTADAPERRALK
jgi:hypothetical protein